MGMHKIFIFVVLCFLPITLLSACGTMSNIEESTVVSMEKYYTIEDFQSITIGKSTIQDVYQNVCGCIPNGIITVTSFGGLCEFPMENGEYIQVKFYGKDLIVGAIEIVRRTGDGSAGQGTVPCVDVKGQGTVLCLDKHRDRGRY